MKLFKRIWFPALVSALLLAIQLINLVEGGSGPYFVRTVTISICTLATILLLLKQSYLAVITAIVAAISWIGWLFWISYRSSIDFGYPMTDTLPIELTLSIVALIYVWSTWSAVKEEILE